MKYKKSLHKKPVRKTKKKVASRATREQTEATKVPGGWDGSGGPGRPKGSTLDPVFKLTPRQMKIAEGVVSTHVEKGIFPASISQLADHVGCDRTYLRRMLLRENFMRYIDYLLKENGILLEMSFWRGMAVGMQTGDPRVLHLYAQMTGKVQKGSGTKLQVEIVAPDGSKVQLPQYTDSASDDDIIDAEIIEEEDSGD